MSATERKEQNYIAKPPGKKENFASGPKKSNSSDKKFKGKTDTRNNNSKETNGMHNKMPLTKEHQMELGKGESKPTPGNPKGYSKRQLTVLNFFRDRDSRNKIRNINDDGKGGRVRILQE